jgi:hypothetical protein
MEKLMVAREQGREPEHQQKGQIGSLLAELHCSSIGFDIKIEIAVLNKINRYRSKIT